MKFYLLVSFLILAAGISTNAVSSTNKVMECTEFFHHDLPHVVLESEEGELSAKLSAKLQSGVVVNESYRVKDISGIEGFRFVDEETSGGKFLLKGGNTASGLVLSVQALTSGFDVVQATLGCNKN